MVLTSLYDRTTGIDRTHCTILYLYILITPESEIVLAFSQDSRRSVVWEPQDLRSDIMIAPEGSLLAAVPDAPALLNHRDVPSGVVSIAYYFLLYLMQRFRSILHKKVNICFIEI